MSSNALFYGSMQLMKYEGQHAAKEQVKPAVTPGDLGLV